MSESIIKTWEQAADDGDIYCLLDGARGIYLPQAFANGDTGLNPIRDCGCDNEDVNAVSDGPDEEWYWEAWDKILCDASWTTPDGVWRLQLGESGDLFAVRTETPDGIIIEIED